MRPRKPTLRGALGGMLIGVLPFVALAAFLYLGLGRTPYGDDQCLNDTARANDELFHAQQRQDASAMAAAYDVGVRGLSECLRDPRRVGDNHRHYAASLVEARKAAADWHAFAAKGGAWRDNPGRNPTIAEY
jgi:hypothetical protein